ncbi:MAG: septum formation protein Maf [Erysipelotrichaceae bacterium]|nr:septum formation protein Maf [Erysipelotrichaceae bacterium]
MRHIVLASQSPRRQELLRREGIDFTVDASFIDEILDESLTLEKRLEKLAVDKGMDVAKRHPDDIIISADTTVYHNHTIIGKANDSSEARDILMSLSDTCHSVFTSVAIIDHDDVLTFVDETKVYFKPMDDYIDDYLESKNWVGKAGAYGIQDDNCFFIDHIEGDFDNVVGLPVTRLIKILKERHYID